MVILTIFGAFCLAISGALTVFVAAVAFDLVDQ